MKTTQRMPPAKTHRQTKREKGSTSTCSTAGSAKGENCKATPLDKAMSKRNRSYKMKGYFGWTKKMDEKFKKHS